MGHELQKLDPPLLQELQALFGVVCIEGFSQQAALPVSEKSGLTLPPTLTGLSQVKPPSVDRLTTTAGV